MNRARRNSVATLALLAFTVAVPLACGGSDKPAANASFSFGGDSGAPQNCQPGQPCPPPAQTCAPGQPCPPPVQTCAPGQPCPPPAQTCPPGQQCPADPNGLAGLLAAGSAWLGQMGGDPVDLGIKAAAAKYAPGMSPDGQVAKGNVAEGGHVGFIFNMDPSRCYTIVGFGVGVTDLDLNLLAPPIYTISAGQDGMAGPTAVIGAAPKPMCPLVPLQVPYKIDIYAKKGGGAVGAQVYSKPK